MSTDYSILLEQYPEVVSKDQMYKICHISKRKATWLSPWRMFQTKEDALESLAEQKYGSMSL